MSTRHRSASIAHRLAAAALASIPACAYAQREPAPAAKTAQATAAAADSRAAAPTTPQLELVPPDKWSVRIEPQVWYVAPEGKLTLPGSPPTAHSVKLETLNAEDTEAGASGLITIRVPHEDADSWSSPTFWDSGWFFSIGGGVYSGDGSSLAPAGGLVLGSLNIAAGASVKTSVDWSTYHAEGGKWIAGSDFDSGGDTRIDLYAVAGGRLHTQDIKVTSGGATTEASESFGAALLGVRMDVKFPGDFAAIVDVNANFWPGDPSCFGFEIAPTFVWEPTPNVGLQIGYRLLIADCESGSDTGPEHYKLDGSLAGLFAGIEFRF